MRGWMSLLCVTALVLAVASPALAGPPQLIDPAPGAKLIWRLKPNIAEISMILHDYNVPEGAAARVNCTIAKNGRPSSCVVVEETPSGRGMGEAMVEIAALYKAQSKDSLDQPSAGQRVTLGFRVGNTVIP